METTQIRELRNRIGRAIRKLRKEERISSSYLAKVLGLSQSTVSRIESGALSLPAEKLCFLAQSFNRPLSFFIGEQSPTTYNNEDILRAGLVYYGASHLKAKRTIDVQEYWRTYADFLGEALTAVNEPRAAAAIAVTLYNQALKGKLNTTRLLTTIQNERLIANLVALISLIEQAKFKLNQPIKTRERAIKRLIDLRNDALHDRKLDNRFITVANISPQYVAGFINESLSHG